MSQRCVLEHLERAAAATSKAAAEIAPEDDRLRCWSTSALVP